MVVASPEDLARQAGELAVAGGGDEQVDKLVESAGGDRARLEAARDLAASQVRNRVDDWSATAALRLLNRALAKVPRTDPFDWQVRWERNRKP